MDVDAAIGATVKHTGPVVLVTLETSERCPLDVVQHRVDLGGRRRVLRRPSGNAARVSLLGGQRVDDLRGQPRVAAQD